jgi:hypothetical protein
MAVDNQPQDGLTGVKKGRKKRGRVRTGRRRSSGGYGDWFWIEQEVGHGRVEFEGRGLSAICELRNLFIVIYLFIYLLLF